MPLRSRLDMPGSHFEDARCRPAAEPSQRAAVNHHAAGLSKPKVLPPLRWKQLPHSRSDRERRMQRLIFARALWRDPLASERFSLRKKKKTASPALISCSWVESVSFRENLQKEVARADRAGLRPALLTRRQTSSPSGSNAAEVMF